MKVVRRASEKITTTDLDTQVYRKDADNPEITIYAANKARTLAPRFPTTWPNDTDELPDTVMFEGRMHRPVVCAHPTSPNTYIAGFMDLEHDTLFLCEYPMEDVSHAARCAHQMILDPQCDHYDLVNSTSSRAA